jgi:hypothetical protein
VEEEGVLFDNVKLVDRGRFLEAELRAQLASGRYPSRNIDNNVSDLKAQLAACEKGIQVSCTFAVIYYIHPVPVNTVWILQGEACMNSGAAAHG